MMSWSRINTGLITWEECSVSNQSVLLCSLTSLKSSLLMSSSLLQRRNLKTNSSPITNKLHSALKLVNHNHWYFPITIFLPEKSIFKLTLQILSDEDNDAEVSIEAVTDKQRREDQEPGGVVKQPMFFNLENNPSLIRLQYSVFTFSTSSTENTVRQTSHTQISKTETPSHLNNSFCLNNIFLAGTLCSLDYWTAPL